MVAIGYNITEVHKHPSSCLILIVVLSIAVIPLPAQPTCALIPHLLVISQAYHTVSTAPLGLVILIPRTMIVLLVLRLLLLVVYGISPILVHALQVSVQVVSHVLLLQPRFSLIPLFAIALLVVPLIVSVVQSQLLWPTEHVNRLR